MDIAKSTVNEALDISQQDAKKSLEQIQSVIDQTRKKIATGSTSPLLILWGVIWFVAYLAMYLSYLFALPAYRFRLTSHISIDFYATGLPWLILIPIGVALSWIIGVRRAPTRSASDRRFGLSWLILFVYGSGWLALLSPWNEYQISTFLASLAMFAYVVMGLWTDRVLLWLGVAVTALIVAGYLLFHFQPAFWLWMAVLGGGSLAGTGLYIRTAWR